jgi:hypothetical protein
MHIETNISVTNAAQRIDTNTGAPELNGEAYDEGRFFAQTDWPWTLKESYEHARPTSMAQHLATSWAFVANVVCPEWAGDEAARMSFWIGYEDGATELADAGEADYQALAEAGTVAETCGWVLQSAPWCRKAISTEKMLRAVRAAWAGASAWLTKAEATGRPEDRIRADEAQIRAEAAGDASLGIRYSPPTVEACH